MNLEDVIFYIAPKETPLLSIFDITTKRKFANQFGQSMRARKTRKAKPLRFTPRFRKIHEWQFDALAKDRT